MLTADQMSLRLTGVGSTDVSRLCGLSPWGTAHDVWCEKLGLVGPKEQTLAMRVGHICEELTSQLYCEEMGCTVRKSTTVRHPALSWALATPDRIVEDDERVVEAKFVGWRMARDWTAEADGVPPYVATQCQWIMACTGINYCDVAAILGGEEFRVYRLERHERLLERMIAEAERFWFDHVVARVPPPVDGTSSARRMLEAIHSTYRPEMIAASPNADEWIERLMAAQRDKKLAEASEVEAKNHLCEIIGNAGGDGIASGYGNVYWRRATGNKARSFRFYPKKGLVAA